MTCYYETAINLAGTDAGKLAVISRNRRRRAGAPVVQIQWLFRAAGLPSSVTTYTNLDEIRDTVITAGQEAGHDVRFGLAFVRPDGTGHMVVVAYAADTAGIGDVEYLDYQRSGDCVDAAADVARGTRFFLFT